MLNRKLCAQWGIIMCSTANYWNAQQEFRCSMGSYVLNGKLLCAQLDIIGVLNRKLCAQQETIMCSTGHYWGVQQEVMSSMGNYNVLNWTLLECSMGIIMCSIGHYWGAEWEFRCSMGSYVLNGKL